MPVDSVVIPSALVDRYGWRVVLDVLRLAEVAGPARARHAIRFLLARG